ncbi:MAG: nitroreductase family protein [Sphingomonadaceae bacterium]|nr:nitroreductase family protein [Sphingomonadaceae bacterium]
MSTARNAHHPVAPIFLERWSPRAFDGSVIPDADLMTIFEAARWAPSSFNYQPWRLLYAKREDADWERFLDLLIPFNRSWAQSASVLIYFLSDTQMEMTPGALNPSHSHSFDTGAAWAYLALQATMLGYHAHGMVGVDFDRARSELKVPDRYRFEAAAVIGRIADKSTLDEKLQAREVPSDRKPVAEFAFRGEWPSA